MKITLKITALFLFVGIFASCKKDKLTPTEIMTAGTCWKMVLLEGFDPTNNLWVSVPVDACEADNCFAFKADQSFTMDEGTAKCDPADAQIINGSWSLSDDEKKLSLSDSGDTQVGDIVELVSGKLVYQIAIDDAKIRVTLKAD